VIKDSEDGNDSDSSPDYEADDDRGAEGDTEEEPEEVPEGDAPQGLAPQLEPTVEEVPQEEVPEGDAPQEQAPQLEPMVEVDPQEEVLHQVIEPQAAPAPASSGLPRLYVQLMPDIAEDPPMREESQGSSPIVLE
jgi:hypothetical protein